MRVSNRFSNMERVLRCQGKWLGELFALWLNEVLGQVGSDRSRARLVSSVAPYMARCPLSCIVGWRTLSAVFRNPYDGPVMEL